MMDRIKSWIFFLLFFGGYLLAGSESQYFPANALIGAGMVAASIFFVPALERLADVLEKK